MEGISLICLTQTHADITDQITEVKLHIQDYDDIVMEMESVKGKIERRIRNELEKYPIWNEWLVNVPDIGDATAAKLVLHYYFKSIPFCQDCDIELENTGETFRCPNCKKYVQKDGNLVYKVFLKNTPRFSSWWLHCIVDVLQYDYNNLTIDGQDAEDFRNALKRLNDCYEKSKAEKEAIESGKYSCE